MARRMSKQALAENMEQARRDGEERRRWYPVREDGTEVVAGDVLESRTGPYLYEMVSRFPEGDSSGKIIVRLKDTSGPVGQREFYPSVFDLELRRRKDAPCG